MPELPEVETIRRGLQTRIPGRRIGMVEVRKTNVLEVDQSELEERVRGQTVKEVARRGKFLFIRLERDTIVIHLGMTGQLTFWDQDVDDSAEFDVHPTTGLQRIRQHGVDKHTHVTFWFDDGNGLHYRDIRMFGNIRLAKVGNESEIPSIGKLGPEPLTSDFKFRDFQAGLKNRKSNIKARLLDQRFVAGLGNIYVDEALFRSKIHPTRLAGSLKKTEQKRLFEAIPVVLELGIHFGGTSMRDYVNSDGQQGSNQEELLVYGQTGQPCWVCNTAIVRIVVAQRGSHFCPRCQRVGS